MIRNLTRGSILARHPRVARSFGWRLRGMIGRRFSDQLDALVFHRCSSIHTCFMGQAIDVAFLDEDLVVRRVSVALPPWRAVGCRSSVTVVECPAGSFRCTGLETGDRLAFEGLADPCSGGV